MPDIFDTIQPIQLTRGSMPEQSKVPPSTQPQNASKGDIFDKIAPQPTSVGDPNITPETYIPQSRFAPTPTSPTVTFPDLDIGATGLVGRMAIDTAKDIGYSATLGHTREALRGESPPPGPLSLRSLSPPLIALRAIGPEGRRIADIISGVVHDATNLSVVIPAAYGMIKSAIRSLSGISTMTERGAMEEALRIFTEQSRGTPSTQTQIQSNIKSAKELETKIPGLKFTQGQLTNDASAIALERALARKSGQDLSQSQRELANQALRDYYSTNVSGTGKVSDLSAQAESMNKQLQEGTKQAEDAVNSEVMRLSRGLDEQSGGSTIFERLSKNKAAMKKQATALYDKIPNADVPSTGLSQGIRDIIKSENNIIEPRTTSMIKLIRGQLKKAAAEGETLPIGYQNLRQIRSRLNSAIRATRSGTSPNLEDARQLGMLRDQVDLAMEQVKDVSPKISQAYKEATSFYRESYVPKFRQGTVADILQPGARGESTKLGMANIASEFDSLDGIDHFKQAVGNDAAANKAMHDYYAMSLLNKAKDPSTGNLVSNKAMQWLSQNSAKLRKLGIYDEFSNVVNMQRTVDAIKEYQAVFNKSVAGRILESDTDSIVTNAFRGSKNYGSTAEQLMSMVKGNKAAIEGLKTAISDHIIRESETTALDFFQQAGATVGDTNFNRSVARMTKQVQDFMPALRVIYKDEPNKIVAINDVLKAYQTLGRTAKSPVGQGSDTFELFGKTLDVIAGSTAPGQWYAFKTIRDMINKYGRQNVEQFLTKTMFDPAYAETLTKITKGNVLEKRKAIDYLIRLGAIQASQQIHEEQQNKPEPMTLKDYLIQQAQ